MPNNKNYLHTIIEQKKIHVKQQKLLRSEEQLKKHIPLTHRSFAKAIENKISQQGLAIIAEIKKASPSQGIIREHYNPIHIAQNYAQHGATCLSILTDQPFFEGKDEDLQTVCKSVNLPVLRKDFIIDAYQIYESAFLGADCILLIAAVLSSSQLKFFYDLAVDLGLDALIEVHNSHELEMALQTKSSLIGINNRNLTTFDVDLNTTISLSKQIDSNRRIICESGIHSSQDIQRLLDHQVRAFLIGETFMRAHNPGEKLAQFIKDARDTQS